jgi:ketosteroid isomerase-like protein
MDLFNIICVRIIPGMLLALCAVGCAPSSFDAAAESGKLTQRDADWSSASFEGKDIDRIVSFWSDDAHVLQPGLPPIDGKTAIRAFVTASLKIPGFKIHWVSEKPVFSPDGKMAYIMSAVETTAPGTNGTLASTHGRSVTVWRRDADDVWRCVVDISNDAPPAA